MAQEGLDEIMEGVERVLYEFCDDFDKVQKYKQDKIEFLINKWKNDKRYFTINEDDSYEVTVEDVIKAVFYFAWDSRGKFEYMNK